MRWLADTLTRLAAWISRPCRREAARRQALAALMEQFPAHRSLIVAALVSDADVAATAAMLAAAEVQGMRSEIDDRLAHVERSAAARHGAMMDQLNAFSEK